MGKHFVKEQTNANNNNSTCYEPNILLNILDISFNLHNKPISYSTLFSFSKIHIVCVKHCDHFAEKETETEEG